MLPPASVHKGPQLVTYSANGQICISSGLFTIFTFNKYDEFHRF